MTDELARLNGIDIIYKSSPECPYYDADQNPLRLPALKHL